MNRLQIFKISFLRNILIISFLISAVLPICHIVLIHPSFTKLLATSTEEEAVRVARSLESLVIEDRLQLFRKSLSLETLKTIARVKDDFGLMKLKVYSGSGEIIYSTDAKEIGKINPKEYFHDVLAKGKIYTKFVEKGTESLEDEKVAADVVETYIPILGEQNKFIGAFEIYYDISSRKETLDRLLAISSLLLFTLPISLLGAIIIVLIQAGKNITQRQQVEEELRGHRDHLEDLVDERTAKFIEANVKLKEEIDSRTRAEEALRDSERKLRLLSSHLLTAQEGERQRFSRELHDKVAQDLSTLKIGCDTLIDDQPRTAQEVRKELSAMSELIHRSIIAIRDLAYDLRPPSLDQLGLVRTVYQLCNEFSEKSEMTVDFHSAGLDDLSLDSDVEINLYRLIQEALNNIRKHADATHVTVRLVASFPKIIVRIEDDGKGFDVEDRLAKAAEERRMGLQSMQERVILLLGKMKIQSRPMQGTTIMIEVPYAERTHGSENKHNDY